MKIKLKIIVSLIFLFSMLFVSISSKNTYVYSIQLNTQESNVEFNESWNATSPVDFFNESKHPRYPLVARPFGIIEYPHKGNPIIAEFGESFNILVNISQSAESWDMTLTNGSFSMSLNILSSLFEENLWIFNVQPSLMVEGLFDLQVNCSLSSDYQTHAVKIVEEKSYPFTFVQISDTHFPAYSEPINTTDINLKEFEKIRALNPDFVIVTGDVIQGPTWTIVNPETGYPMSAESQFKLAFWALDLLNLPVYIIHGNHDYSYSTLLPDLPDEKWKKYMGHIRYQNFTYLDWSFVGFGSYFDGLTEDEYNKVSDILSAHQSLANVLYYHHDFGVGQVPKLLNTIPIEVALFGHEHQDIVSLRNGALLHCQEPLFHEDFAVFSITNSTAISFRSITYDFTGFELPESTTPTTPTDNTPFSTTAFLTSILLVGLLIKKRKLLRKR